MSVTAFTMILTKVLFFFYFRIIIQFDKWTSRYYFSECLSFFKTFSYTPVQYKFPSMPLCNVTVEALKWPRHAPFFYRHSFMY